MAKTDDKVMKFVEDELKKKPDIDVKDLYEQAKKIKSGGVSKLSLRQFNARYPLQVKRRQSQKKGGRSTKRKRSTSRRRRTAPSNGKDRDAVRDTLLRFASEVAGAEHRKDLVKVLAEVDKYVDEVLKVAGS